MGRRSGIALVVVCSAFVARALALGDLAPFILGAVLLVANVVIGRRAVARARRARSGPRAFVGPLAVSWLAISLLPAHNFAYRSSEEATTSIGIEPLVELLVFMLAGVVALVVIHSLEPTLERAQPPMILFLLPLWVLASSTWSLLGPYAFARGLQMLTVPFVAWATMAIGRADRGATDAVLLLYQRWFLLVTSALAVLGVLFGPVFVPTTGENLDRFSWVGAHPNGAGLVLSVAIVIVVATPARLLRLPQPVVVAMAVGFGAAMYLNHSRTAWACLAGGLLVTFVLKGHLIPLTRWVGTPLLAGAGLAAVWFFGSDIWDYLLRDRDSDSLSTGNGRLELWGIGLRALETPFDWIGGLGYGAARSIFVEELPWARTAHNSILSLLVSVGVVGVALLLVVIAHTARNILIGRTWTTSANGVTIVALFAIVLLNGIATDILAEPNIGFAIVNLVTAVVAVQRLWPHEIGVAPEDEPIAGRGRTPLRR